jgi:hypothetical protein
VKADWIKFAEQLEAKAESNREYASRMTHINGGDEDESSKEFYAAASTLCDVAAVAREVAADGEVKS